MDASFADWLNLLLRWAHVVAAIAWIGASFHFVALDNSLVPPADPSDRERGVGGERWAVHGGGFYHQQKYPVSPPRLPERLHWSMWESYATWLTGFALFTVMYLVNAGSFLVDTKVFDWSPASASAAALAFPAVFWLAYHGICRTFGLRRRGDAIVGVLVLLLVVFASWLACRLFAGRAAFVLVGAALATAMSANVLFLIIPGQRKVVAALREGRPVDPLHGLRGKQRSVHNTYFTLPVVITMLSNHYGFLYGTTFNWVVLVALMLSGALIRQSFVLRHQALAQGRDAPWGYAIAGTLLLAALMAGGLAWRPAPTPESGQAAPTLAQAYRVVALRCVPCHSQAAPNKGVRLDQPSGLEEQASAVYQQAVRLKTMPLNNVTQMTAEERALLGRWFEAREAGR